MGLARTSPLMYCVLVAKHAWDLHDLALFERAKGHHGSIICNGFEDSLGLLAISLGL